MIAVPSALVAAESHSGQGPIIVALASKGDTCWCTRLHRENRIWSIIGEPSLTDSSQVELDGVEALLGDEHLPAAIAEICEKMHINVVQPVLEPAGCLVVAERMLQAGLITDPLSVHPLYPRQPEAATLWEKAKGTGKRARK
jgi:hypothetical protein